MNTCKQKEIYLVPFPFSNLVTKKVRPVLVLSNDDYNSKFDDVLVCGITSNLTMTEYSLILDPSDMESPGVLKQRSRIKADTISSIEQSLLIKRIGSVGENLYKEVVKLISELISS